MARLMPRGERAGGQTPGLNTEPVAPSEEELRLFGWVGSVCPHPVSASLELPPLAPERRRRVSCPPPCQASQPRQGNRAILTTFSFPLTWPGPRMTLQRPGIASGWPSWSEAAEERSTGFNVARSSCVPAPLAGELLPSPPGRVRRGSWPLCRAWRAGVCQQLCRAGPELREAVRQQELPKCWEGKAATAGGAEGTQELLAAAYIAWSLPRQQ